MFRFPSHSSVGHLLTVDPIEAEMWPETCLTELKQAFSSLRGFVGFSQIEMIRSA